MNDQVSALRDALALYAVTRSETWSGLNIASDRNTQEEIAIRAALFGDGSEAESLISQIIIGANAFNSYPNIHEVLMRLGIASGLDAQHHFHVYLNPPDALPIGPMNLMADTASAGTDFALDVVSQTGAQGLLDYAQSVIQGEELMFIMDVPAVPAQETPIVLVQADTTNAGTVPQPDYILKYCTETESTGDPRSAMRAVDPAGMLAVYLEHYKGAQFIDLADVKNITLLENTKHGEITTEVDNTGLTFFGYDPEPEYVGKDRAVFMAEYQGVRYKIVVDLRVFLFVDEKAPVCPPPQLIKVTKPSSGASSYGSDYYDLASVSVTFADLPGGAVGQTVGSNITLDANAAGFNWFIDTTPADNSEYLPTSNPNEWVAKDGSDAYGKMDMLSVLLHEYGHALGIEHSADNHDYMATTLTPGVRRMPSADELALMQSLVAQIKGEMTATASTLSPTLPLQGGGGLPLPIPLGAGFGIAFLGRLRGSRYGDMSIVPDYATLTTQYAVAARCLRQRLVDS